jgi:hypothetical protein
MPGLERENCNGGILLWKSSLCDAKTESYAFCVQESLETSSDNLWGLRGLSPIIGHQLATFANKRLTINNTLRPVCI